MKRVLILGRRGQLAQALLAAAPPGVSLEAWGSAELDLLDADIDIARRLDHWGPEAVINASAYTAVDKAESEADSAWRLNSDAVREIGAACTASGAALLHVSTDFVFDGDQSHPYRPQDPCRPLGVYGASKRGGEEALQECCPAAVVVRTAWVYSGQGRNFLTTMLRLMTESDGLRVVADQVGTPTRARHLAQALWQAVASPLAPGVWHFTDAGVASWYDFAVAIQDEARALGMLDRAAVIEPIAVEDYPTPAARPHYSVLDSRATWRALDQAPVHWRHALALELRDLAERARGG